MRAWNRLRLPTGTHRAKHVKRYAGSAIAARRNWGSCQI